MPRDDARPYRDPGQAGGPGLSRADLLRRAGAAALGAGALAAPRALRAARPPLADLARETQGALATA